MFPDDFGSNLGASLVIVGRFWRQGPIDVLTAIYYTLATLSASGSAQHMHFANRFAGGGQKALFLNLF